MRLLFLCLILISSLVYVDTVEYTVAPGETLEVFVKQTIDDTCVDYELPLDAGLFPESYRLSLLGLTTKPKGRFDNTGWNFILEDDNGNDIGVILDSDFSGKGHPETVMFNEFPLVANLTYDLSQKEYIEKYKDLAKKEEAIYGIPAAITLAQGILESNSGNSYLARSANNHFGLKCFSRKCKPGHCVNRTDDSHKDFFLAFDTVEESFKSHSKRLKGDRYKKLFKLKKTDLHGWAKGLKECGYATSKTYDVKLMNLIKRYELDKI